MSIRIVWKWLILEMIKIMIYEINVDDMDEMIESYVDQNENIAVSDYFMML